MVRFLLTILSLLQAALAQNNSLAPNANSGTPTTQAPTAIYTVTVGKDGLSRFEPESLAVAAGSKVVFQFYPGHHSVVQGAFDKPCSPPSEVAFYSGFVESNNGPNITVFTIAVDHTDPIWFYCAAPGHCQQGMVGVINPSHNQTLGMYKAATANSTTTKVPITNRIQGGVLADPASLAAAAAGKKSGASRVSSVGVSACVCVLLVSLLAVGR